jgi:hypothetical protein
MSRDPKRSKDCQNGGKRKWREEGLTKIEDGGFGPAGAADGGRCVTTTRVATNSSGLNLEPLDGIPITIDHHPPIRVGTMASRLLASFLSMCTAANAYRLSDRPTLKYGTAWKKEATADLVEKAVKAGFRHIDTACQPRHYNEAGVGDGWIAAARSLNLNRNEIWIQSKFSGLNAHDPGNAPYDVDAPLEERVRQSLEKSLENLKTDYLDSWIMHGPEDNWDDHWKVRKISTCPRLNYGHEHHI